MTTVNTFEAEIRQHSGTGGARAVRRAGLVPGIIYGGKAEPALCAVSPKLLNIELHKSGFFSKVFTLSLGNKTEKVMAKAVQLHPVTDQPLHIDFMRVSGDNKVTVAVPVKYINEDKAPGLKRGGVLNILVHNLEVKAPIDSIPGVINIDLSGLDIHSSIHSDKLDLPSGVQVAHPERDYTLATILAPTTESSKAGEEGGAA